MRRRTPFGSVAPLGTMPAARQSRKRWVKPVNLIRCPPEDAKRAQQDALLDTFRSDQQVHLQDWRQA
jgi:hypothetical protein